MVFESINGRRYARFERLAGEAGLAHAFSTRGLDLSDNRGDTAARIERFAAFAGDLEIERGRLCYCDQVHRGRIAVVDEPGRLEATDGVVTSVVGLGLLTFSADCPLVLVYDPRARVLGMAHSSWRCTVGHMTSRLVDTMCERFGCRAAEMLAGIGPSAGPERYEVKDDVYAAAAELPDRDALFPRRGGRMTFDLWTANRRQLEAVGVLGSNIEIAGICTMADTERFYSYRREGTGCGHFGLMATLH